MTWPLSVRVKLYGQQKKNRTTERNKNMQNSQAPGPLPDRQAQAVYIGFRPLSLTLSNKPPI